MEGGAAAHVEGLDPHQLVEPALRVEGDQTSSTVSLADVTGVRREGAEVTVSQPSCGLPSDFVENERTVLLTLRPKT